MTPRAVIFACLLGATSAFLFAQEKWDGLSTTFGVNPFSPNVFTGQPRTEADAKAAGWTMMSDCSSEGPFRGKRYVKGDDYAIILLYDVNGYIAGMQCGVLKSASSTYPPAKQRGNVFQEDGPRWTLTAYFTDPATICTTGRSAAKFAEEGTGNRLMIQNGSNPVTQSVSVPATQAEMTGTSWSLGHCFVGMGVHYWYDVAADMNCEDFQPVFVLYNEKRLTAWGWALGTPNSSPHMEHPPLASVSAFMNPVPKCLGDYSQLSTMHVYMTAHPSADLC